MGNASRTTSRRAVAIVGAGALGRVLARRLTQQGYPVTAVLSRNRTSARALAREVGAAVGSDDWNDLPFDVSVVMVCVPDDAIPAVAASLADLPRDWASTVVGHTSGARTAEALAPLARAGAATFSFHPMQTFTSESDPSAFDGIYVGVEGDPDAVPFGAQLASDLGAQAVRVPTEAKTRYHLAAAVASNGLVALMGMVNEIIASAGLDADDGLALMRPLIERTQANVAAHAPEGALTGPAARGDLGTVNAHLEALATHLPHLLPAYAALTNEMVRLAVRSGRLDAGQAEPVLDALHDALPESDSPSAG